MRKDDFIEGRPAIIPPTTPFDMTTTTTPHTTTHNTSSPVHTQPQDTPLVIPPEVIVPVGTDIELQPIKSMENSIHDENVPAVSTNFDRKRYKK